MKLHEIRFDNFSAAELVAMVEALGEADADSPGARLFDEILFVEFRKRIEAGDDEAEDALEQSAYSYVRIGEGGGDELADDAEESLEEFQPGGGS